ncbi:trypsin-like peptidase domain-containing protein [Mycobacterium marinum]|uniref:trypsin-like peptidase domain-containing protein n=1 Tax=Mycobacterium marinum TaxID=1781 RepID=UPI000B97686B|nr:trypsin-like peptidase domain-containing protein [Mycobacterium marinum]
MVSRARPARFGSGPVGGRIFALLAVAALLVAGSPGIAYADDGRPQANPEERAAALIRPAVMYIVIGAYGWVRLPTGQRLSHYGDNPTKPFTAGWGCTAFTVNPDGWLATAGHCVDPQSARDLIFEHAASDYVKQFPDSPEALNPVGAVQWLRKNARVEGETAEQGPEVSITVLYGSGAKVAATMNADVVDFRPIDKGDVALLRVDRRNMPSSELTTDADVSIGTRILAVGYPKSTQDITDPSLDPTYKSGTVSKKSLRQTIPEYEIDAPISDGMSGGPTIELNGKVIGLNSFRPASESQPFNFVAPVAGLAALLAAKGVVPTLGPADLSYRKGLDLYYSGHYTAAIKEFDTALSMSPDFPGLVDLRTSAVNLRQQYGDVSVLRGSNLMWYIGLVVVLAVGGGVTFTVLRSRRQRSAASPVPDFQPIPDGWSPVGGRAEGAGEHAADAAAPADAEHLTAGEPHFCANCGAQHHHTEKFCPNCGEPIVIDASAHGKHEKS